MRNQLIRCAYFIIELLRLLPHEAFLSHTGLYQIGALPFSHPSILKKTCIFLNFEELFATFQRLIFGVNQKEEKIMKKILPLVLALLMLATIPAFAETSDLADGVETITLDSGISLTYNKYEFKIDVDENGDVAGAYLGETPEPIGFNIVTAEDTDAEEYMTEAAATHEATLEKGMFFSDENEWLYFSYDNESSEEYINQVVVYARNFDGGCYIVTAFGCYEKDAENEETASSENTAIDDGLLALEQILDSLSFENQTGSAIANPWVESDMQGVAEATGFEMTAPEGATDVTYSYMQESGLAQMRYVLDETEWVYRIQTTDELTDISGMAYEWTLEEEGAVSGRSAVYYNYCAPDGGTENDVQVVNWYDAVTGVTYSLSAVSADLDGMDIQAYAEKLYVPLQGEATGDAEADSESELKDYFIGEHKRSYDSSILVLADNNDGTFAVTINVIGLCNLENGVGTFEDHKMSFEIDDPNGNKMSGVIYRDSDNTLTVKITDSTWTYLKNGDVLEGFGK